MNWEDKTYNNSQKGITNAEINRHAFHFDFAQCDIWDDKIRCDSSFDEDGLRNFRFLKSVSGMLEINFAVRVTNVRQHGLVKMVS